jgi:hypothetical protein
MKLIIFAITLLLLLAGCAPKLCQSDGYHGNPTAFPDCDAEYDR